MNEMFWLSCYVLQTLPVLFSSDVPANSCYNWA